MTRKAKRLGAAYVVWGKSYDAHGRKHSNRLEGSAGSILSWQSLRLDFAYITGNLEPMP